MPTNRKTRRSLLDVSTVLQRAWYQGGVVSRLLWPLGALFCGVVQLRRWTYGTGWLASDAAPVPVVIVGNITVGGTGKTPLVAWLARHLLERGYRPGVLTRGYRGEAVEWPQFVTADASAAHVGDEALLLARRSGCPVVAGPDRGDDVRYLLERAECDIILSDDGMQHYGLKRDVEIAVIDGQRGLGNRLCLPAGPLREPVSRLHEVDLVIVNGTDKGRYPFAFQMQPTMAVNVKDPRITRPLDEFRGRTVTAVAGIGNPGRFFDGLRGKGLDVEGHAFPDHHPFRQEDLAPFGDGPLLMTEKDAVKCESWAADDWWYVAVELDVEPAFVAQLDLILEGLNYG